MNLNLFHPLPGATETDGFGWRPPISGVRPAELHDGQDFAGKPGAPIRAAHSGRVTYSGWDSTGGGWMVKIRSNRCTTLYLHMLRASKLRTGDTIAVGELVGYVGSTGNSTGPHLHFTVRLPDGTAVDPTLHIRKDIMLTPKDIENVAEATAARLLTYKIKRTDNPKLTTTLRAALANRPKYIKEFRRTAKHLRQKLDG